MIVGLLYILAIVVLVGLIVWANHQLVPEPARRIIDVLIVVLGVACVLVVIVTTISGEMGQLHIQ